MLLWNILITALLAHFSHSLAGLRSHIQKNGIRKFFWGEMCDHSRCFISIYWWNELQIFPHVKLKSMFWLWRESHVCRSFLIFETLPMVWKQCSYFFKRPFILWYLLICLFVINLLKTQAQLWHTCGIVTSQLHFDFIIFLFLLLP